MYQEEIIDKPYMLDIDYLIFGYRINQKNIVRECSTEYKQSMIMLKWQMIGRTYEQV